MGTCVGLKLAFGVTMGDAYVNDERLYEDDDFLPDLLKKLDIGTEFTVEFYGNEYWNYPVLTIGRSVKGSGSEASPVAIDTIFLPTKHELADLEIVCKALAITYRPRYLAIARAEQ